MSAFAALRRFTRTDPPKEQCELCAAKLGANHEHLAEPLGRKLVCVCGPCALLFSSQHAGRFRRVPSRLERLANNRIADDRWGDLGVPVSLAFFYQSTSAGGMLAVYPSPAGPLESPVETEAWNALAGQLNLPALAPDVEALLINRMNGANDVYLCSTDRCYHLIGLVRANWRGMTGGPELWRTLEEYFVSIQAESRGQAE